MASTVVLATPTASPTVFPTAGIGGEYYTNPLFEVPVYTGYARSAITWQMLDAWNIVGLQYAVAEGIACGLIWATFIYLLALTPSRKRSTRFHIILFTGLCFETTHLTMDAISLVTPGLSANSAYLVLTRDMASSVWTTSYKAFYTSTQALNWVAFICATTCLWIQAQGLLATLKVRSSIAYVVVLVYLVSAALATLIASLVYWIYQIKVIPDNIDWDMALYARKLRNIYLVSSGPPGFGSDCIFYTSFCSAPAYLLTYLPTWGFCSDMVLHSCSTPSASAAFPSSTSSRSLKPCGVDPFPSSNQRASTIRR